MGEAVTDIYEEKGFYHLRAFHCNEGTHSTALKMSLSNSLSNNQLHKTVTQNNKNYMNNNKIPAQDMGVIVGAIGFVLAGFLYITFPVQADAATYAYVDVSGDVRSVVATDWQTAIATAPEIHLHSGVLILNFASDFTIVGDNVPAF